ncbi:hypothetical protein FSS13T_14090 [Flavobacterium saliperosum S13]|uniref:YolD-like protein n=2 Tax=Flavobacterium saliperosum TaxID=329186 RepID=A0A1G4VEH2_9FLAO|nr:hypothetical protein [Flavobacterium saliperosum]ESU25940.1 hypothetical protein FSS13T_14090 [Flavobacterium saliperosum S13]SCX05548.1 hypothetical protein SAMN02927925_00842 [Flavobacterium saliperosum]
MNYNFETIDKEKIGSLLFPNSDVLEDDKEAIKQRKEELDRALTLGNLEHLKIKIYFEDDTSKKMVDTTVWGLTEERIILKQGVVIPIKRIYKTI